MNLKLARWGVSLIALSYSGIATAQTAIQPTPPEYSTRDPRSVDLVTGQFNYSTTEVVIGQPGAGGLAHTRGLFASSWRDAQLGSLSVSGSDYIVTYGLESVVFVLSGGSFSPRSNSGATLTQSGTDFTFTSGSGVVVKYTTTYCFTATGQACTDMAMIYEVTQPNGRKLNYHYNTQSYVRSFDPNGNPVYGTVARLQSLTNNQGYQLHYTYGSNTMAGGGSLNTRVGNWLRVASVTGVNNAVDYCAPTAFSCTYSRTWPSVSYSTDVSGNLTATDQSGRATLYSYTGVNGSLVGIRYPGSSTDDVTVAYGMTGVSSVTDATGAWNYSYSTSGSTKTTTSTGPSGEETVVVTNLSVGRPSSIAIKTSAAPTTSTWSYQYDGQYRLQRVTNPEGDYTQLTLDSRGNVTQTLRSPKPGSGLWNVTTSATYPAGFCSNPVTCNFPVTTTDERGNVTDYTWNATHGGLESVTLPAPSGGADRPQTRISYAAQTAYYKNSSGVIVAASSSVTLPTSTSACGSGTVTTCVGTTNESKTTIVYGLSGGASNLLPTSTTAGDGTGALTATTAMTWTPNGDPFTVDGPLAGADDTTMYRYDNARQTVGVVGPDPDGGGGLQNRAQRLTYNPRGQVTLAEQGTTAGYTDPDWAGFITLQRQATSYDSLGRPLTSAAQDAAGNTVLLVQTGYDASGRPDCTAVRMNPTTYPGLPSATAACALTTAYFYGPDRIARYGYDLAGRVISRTDGYATGSAQTESLSYTANGLPTTFIDAVNNTSIVVYDGFDRASRTRYPNATGGGTSAADYEEYGYDDASNLTSYRTRANQTFTTAYDNLNRATTLTAPVGTPNVSYTYDNMGRLKTAAASGQTITRTWDALSRLTSEDSAFGTMSYQYDLAGRRTQQTWPGSVFSMTNSWNLYNEMTAILHGGSTQIIGYSYDNLGRRTGINRGNGVSTTYSYDGIGRLASLSHDLAGSADDVAFTYEYNPAGQILTRRMTNSAYGPNLTASSTAYLNNGLNQVTSVGGTATSYDADGNITNDTTRTYGYDAAGRATSANGTSTLSYDPLGRLDQYVGTNGARFLYDGVQTAGVATSGTTLANRLVPGPGVDEVVAAFNTTGSTPNNYWLQDERSSVIVAADGSTGTPSVINGYDEYGVPASSNAGRLQYTGQLWLQDFGGYHYKARFYSPELGRFLQTDPLGYAVGMNLYGYVWNDPINVVDPTGMCPPCVVAFTVGAVVGGSIEFAKQYSASGGNITTEGYMKIAVQAGIGGGSALIGGGAATIAARTFGPIAAQALGGFVGGGMGGALSNATSSKWAGESWEEQLGSAASGFGYGAVFGGAGAGGLKYVRGLSKPPNHSVVDWLDSSGNSIVYRDFHSSAAGGVLGETASALIGSLKDIYDASRLVTTPSRPNKPFVCEVITERGVLPCTYTPPANP